MIRVLVRVLLSLLGGAVEPDGPVCQQHCHLGRVRRVHGVEERVVIVDGVGGVAVPGVGVGVACSVVASHDSL